MKALFHSCSIAILLASSLPAIAAVIVSNPANGAAVSSPFALSATATPCSSQPVAAMGYSLDYGGTITTSAASIVAQVFAPVGTHILHVKSWGNKGASCVTNVTINVTSPPPPSAPVTNVTVVSPVGGASVSSPFPLAASGTLCSSQTIAAMGYSLDNSTTTTTFSGGIMTASVASTAGAHILHVKSWGTKGGACDTDVSINVAVPAQTVSGPTIPANAIAVNAIHGLDTWKAECDLGTGTETASGVTKLVASPSISGLSRQFITTYSNYGGERYSVNIGADTAATNFVLDTSIYLAAPISDIANIEMDLNQVMANGQTVIFGFQCDGWSQTWDYTANTGSSPTSFNDQWLHTNQTCNPQKWTPDTWHHLQVSYSRDATGNVTFKSVWFDGIKQDFNITTAAAFALGWKPALITNFQIDGMTGLPGTAITYLDNLTIYRW